MATGQPLISVITVVKNDYAGLLRTLESLVPLISNSIEIIVVDGTVNSSFVLAEQEPLAPLNVRWAHAEPKGIYNAMNIGAEMARAEWIWFLNAGDYCVSTEVNFKKMLSLLRSADAQTLGFASPVVITTKNGILYDVDVPRMLSDELHCNHQGVIVRRSSFIDLKGFDENLKMAADGKFLDSLVPLGEIKFVNFVITSFVIGGASSQNFRTTLEEISTYRERSNSKLNEIYIFAKTILRNFLLGGQLKTFGFLEKYLSLREEKMRRIHGGNIDLPSAEILR